MQAMKGIPILLGAGALLVACDVEKDAIAPAGGNNTPTFANVSTRLQSSCGSCHNLSSGRVFVASMDSASLVSSGLVDPANPGGSLLLSKPRSTSHGGGVVSTFGTSDSALVAAWIATLPNLLATTLTAVKTDFAPTIDGIGEGSWTQAKALTVPIAGGWAAATSVSVRAMYDEGYLYLYLRWHDNKASYNRNPWIKNADGTWSVAPAKPAHVDGTNWAQYMASQAGSSVFNPEADQFMYEDKLAMMWNTYGATTVPGFETNGCAIACHDPNNNNSPGTTYNSTRRDLAAKKYLTVSGQYLDMWHWKMVRHNMNGKMDDQNVKYWVPVNDATADNGGRGSDAGNAGYASNPALSGRPMYKSASAGVLPAIHSWPVTDTVRMTDAEVAALPVGQHVANMLTSMPTGSRGDIDAKGVYDRVSKVWTLEIRRALVTGDATDVQFNDLTKTYKWGIAVFDNAQIEHSYSGAVLSLVFKQ